MYKKKTIILNKKKKNLIILTYLNGRSKKQLRNNFLKY